MSSFNADLVLKDYYGILGVDRYASVADIKGAFRKAALKTHPDATGMQGDYDRFILLREAYDVLVDPLKKFNYDHLWNEFYKEGLRIITTEEVFKDATDNFREYKSDSYREEWDFFVREPDEYLSFFDTLRKTVIASLISAFAGVLFSLFMILSVLFISMVSLLLVISAGAALMTSWPTSIVLLVSSVRISRVIRKGIGRFTRTVSSHLAGMILRPLKGIPRHVGKWIFNFNYTSAIVIFAVSMYYMIRFVLTPPYGTAYLRFPPLGVFSALAIYFSLSLPLIFEVIKSALFHYPSLRYSKFSITKRGMITYVADRYLPGRNGR